MLKRLHHKFVLINMVCVMSVLLAVLGIVYYITLKQTEDAAFRQLRFALNRHEIGELDDQKPFSQVKVFETDSQFYVKRKQNETNINHVVLQDIANRINAKDSNYGVISAYDVRYMYLSTGNTIRIALLDRNRELSAMQNLFRTSVTVFLLATVIFFVISWYFGKWAVKPIANSFLRQKRFISDASHELKTPITVILANSNILMNHANDTIESQKQWIENTNVEATRMKQLVEKMLFLSRSDEQALEFTKQVVNLSDLLEETVLIYEAVIFEAGLTLHTNIQSDLILDANQQMLRELIHILLDNACKYCEEKGTISIGTNMSVDQVMFSVSNSGPLLSKAECTHLFERFYRNDTSRSRKEGGYGLGLSIAQTICKEHKGSIEVVSSEQTGTCFTVKLPK